MALSRPWYTDANIDLSVVANTTTAANASKSTIWAIKEVLKGTSIATTSPPTSRWTIEGSSDSVTGLMDGNDRWVTFANVIRGNVGVAHSWIVLKSPNALGPIYMLIDYTEGADGAVNILFSTTPFTGGTFSNTTAPTSTKSWTSVATAAATQTTNRTVHDATTGVFRISRVTDGDGNFWITTAKGGQGRFQWFLGFQTLIETRVGDLVPKFSFWSYDNVSRGAGHTSNNSGIGWCTGSNGGQFLKCVRGRFADDSATTGDNPGGVFAIQPVRNTTMSDTWTQLITSANIVDGTHDIVPVWIYSQDANRLGIRGRLPDCHWISRSAAVGASEPNSITQERTVVGNVLIPFGVAPIL